MSLQVSIPQESGTELTKTVLESTDIASTSENITVSSSDNFSGTAKVKKSFSGMIQIYVDGNPKSAVAAGANCPIGTIPAGYLPGNSFYRIPVSDGTVSIYASGAITFSPTTAKSVSDNIRFILNYLPV